MDASQLSRWASRGTGAAIIALALTLAWQHQTLAAARTHQRTWSAPVQRSVVTDGLIGNRLPSLTLATPEGIPVTVPEPGTDQLLWFVQPAKCMGCIGNGLEWDSFVENARRNGLEATLVFVGADPAEAARLARHAGVSTGFLVDENSTAIANGALYLPSTKFLVAPSGIITMAEARHSNTSCGWNFEAQVAAVRGHGDPSSIRVAGPVAPDSLPKVATRGENDA